jgi:hypothetical protein
MKIDELLAKNRFEDATAFINELEFENENDKVYIF